MLARLMVGGVARVVGSMRDALMAACVLLCAGWVGGWVSGLLMYVYVGGIVHGEGE